MEVASDDCDVVRLRCAFIEAMLVLMVEGMMHSSQRKVNDTRLPGEGAGDFTGPLESWMALSASRNAARADQP
jgi:hypothetical protein